MRLKTKMWCICERAVETWWNYKFCSLKGGFSTVSWLAQVAIHHASLPGCQQSRGLQKT